MTECPLCGGVCTYNEDGWLVCLSCGWSKGRDGRAFSTFWINACTIDDCKTA